MLGTVPVPQCTHNCLIDLYLTHEPITILYGSLLIVSIADGNKDKDKKYRAQVECISTGWDMPERLKNLWPLDAEETDKLVCGMTTKCCVTIK